MKPKNRVMCPSCGRAKMQFENEQKAKKFIEFNGEKITNDTSKLRVYFCEGCGCYHITSKPYNTKYETAVERLITAFKEDVKNSEKIRYIDELYIFFNNLPSHIKKLGGTSFKKWIRENTTYNDNEVGELNKYRKLCQQDVTL